MYLTEEEDSILDEMTDGFPRAPVRGVLKLEPELGFRTTYGRIDYINKPAKVVYDVEIWYVDRTVGARWVEAKRNSHIHRRGVTKIKTMLRLAKLHELVDDRAGRH